MPKTYHVVDVGAGMLEKIGAQALAHPERQYLAIEIDPMQVHRGFSSEPRLRNLPNLTIREMDWKDAFTKMLAEGEKARHITMHTPGYTLLSDDLGNILSHCRRILVPNGKVHWTDEVANFSVKHIAKAAGFGYKYRGRLKHPKTVTEIQFQPIFQHEFTLGLKQAIPSKRARRNLPGNH